MEYTGERMIPEESDFNTYWEHVFRYAFVCKRVATLRVLDIASGEGYGTHALSKVAKSVTGVDISAEAVEHARSKYGLDFRVGSADAIPIQSGSLDAVVSFETIEHVPDPMRFINEVSRVLVSGGHFYVSTPNKDVYHKDQEPNPFHCSELTLKEFNDVLGDKFDVAEMFGQVFPRPPFHFAQRAVGKLSKSLAHHARLAYDQKMRQAFFPEILSKDETMRVRLIEQIPTLSPAFEKLWNPYVIKGLNEAKFGQPTYFIAVARNR